MLPWHISVLLPKSILAGPTPSGRDEVTPEDEKLHRLWGCTLICEAGCLLKLPQVVMVTGQNVFHRFFWRKSLKDARFDAFSVAMACTFLSTKVLRPPTHSLKIPLHAAVQAFKLLTAPMICRCTSATCACAASPAACNVLYRSIRLECLRSSPSIASSRALT